MPFGPGPLPHQAAEVALAGLDDVVDELSVDVQRRPSPRSERANTFDVQIPALLRNEVGIRGGLLIGRDVDRGEEVVDVELADAA